MTVRLPVFGATFLFCLLLLAPLTGSAEPTALTDDLSAASLRQAVSHSINYLRRQPRERTIKLCNGLYSSGWLLESLQSFSALLEEYGDTGPEFRQQVRQQFTICAAASDEKLLITGYYEPEVVGSLTRTSTYRYPLYRVPADLVKRNGHLGRISNGKLIPYWSRQQLTEGNQLKGLELVYLSSLLDCFILHVQGSGQIRLPDGSLRRVHFAAKNGRPYRSIGRLLVDEGKMELAEVTMPSIRAYLAAHPEEVERILYYNQSFIFFNWGKKEQNPAGSLGETLTAGRSVALDQRRYPAGALGYLRSQKPGLDNMGRITEWLPMGRFILNQDSGSAIKGDNRLDLFWGSGPYAKIAAGNMKQSGQLYFLIKKQRQADN